MQRVRRDEWELNQGRFHEYIDGKQLDKTLSLINWRILCLSAVVVNKNGPSNGWISFNVTLYPDGVKMSEFFCPTKNW